LHPEAEWHFGFGPVTADDVVHSYALHTGPDVTRNVVYLLGAEVEAIDDKTVRFTFEDTRVDFLFGLASRGSMLVYSKAQYDAEGVDGYIARPAGTEQYQVVERVIGQHVRFERVDDHWSGSDAPFPEMELRWIGEASTKLAALYAGEVHITNLPRELQPEAIERGMNVLVSTNPAGHVTANFNGLYRRSGDPAFNPDLPWDDVRMREAMNRALDREAILDVVYAGRAEMLPVYGMSPNHEGYVPELVERFDAAYGYDPERAKELLAELGYPDAFADPVIPIIVSQIAGNPEFSTLAELLDVFFSDIGLETELREMDWAGFNSMGRARQSYVINPNRNAPVRPTEIFLNTWYTTDGAPGGGFEDDHIQGLVEQLTRTLDEAERSAMAAEAFTYVFEEYAEMPLAAIFAELTVNPEVVADWTFPGATAAGMSHWHLITPTE
jgi:peptide/nickel transport system substrate-binding protein